MRKTGLGLFLLSLLWLSGCGSPPTYPRSETLNALESRLTRPSATVDQVESYLQKIQRDDRLQRAEDFFAAMAERFPDRPLFRYGWGRALRLQGKNVPARIQYLETLELLNLEDPP